MAGQDVAGQDMAEQKKGIQQNVLFNLETIS